MLRTAYFEHPDYVPLVRRAVVLWNELNLGSHQQIFTRTGGLYLGQERSDLISGSLDSARRHGLDHEFLTTAEIRRRFPQFELPASFAGFWDADAGFVVPETAVTAIARRARSAGAVIAENEAVTTWQSSDRGVTVRTARAEYHAESLVITAGPWSAKLLRDLRIPLRVTRQVMGWVRPREPTRFAPGAFPCWALDGEDGNFYSGFPMHDDAGLKIAVHRPGPDFDPDAPDRIADPADEAEFRPGLARYIPAANGALASMCICLYTMSPDGHFVIDRYPGQSNVYFAAGTSGHGFKFAPAIGEALADLATTGRAALPIEFLSLARFQRG